MDGYFVKVIVTAFLLSCKFLTCTLAQDTPALSSHFAFYGKNRGSCKQLIGDAYVLLVFVSTPNHPWTSAKKKEVEIVARSSFGYIEHEANRYGTRLNMRFGGVDFTVPYEYSSDKQWYKYILHNIYGEESIVNVYRKYERDLKKDTTPILFLFNSWDISHTYVCKESFPNWTDEFCVIFCDTQMHDNYFTHELLHLYGAIDFYDYEGEGIESLARQYFPTSDMLHVSHDIDELTAYIIGWTSRLSPTAQTFLTKTAGLRVR